MKPKAVASILHKFYHTGHAGKEVTLPIRFENPEEVFDPNLMGASGKTRFVNPDLFTRLNEKNETLPRRTQLCLSFDFADKQYFSNDELHEMLTDNLRLQQLKVSEQIFKISLIAVHLWSVTACRAL